MRCRGGSRTGPYGGSRLSPLAWFDLLTTNGAPPQPSFLPSSRNPSLGREGETPPHSPLWVPASAGTTTPQPSFLPPSRNPSPFLYIYARISFPFALSVSKGS